MKKRRKNKLGHSIVWMIVCTSAIFFAKNTVYAGNINAEEQRVIDYYNQTFSYNGKNYVATDAAKQAAYNKLAADGTDLTKEQVDSLIAQARSSIAQGIAEGYLVEVPSGESDTEKGTESEPGTEIETEAGTETESGKDKNTEAGADKKGEPSEASEEHENNTEIENPNQIEKEPASNIGLDVGELIDILTQEGEDNITVYLPDGTMAGNVGDVADGLLQDGALTIEQYSSGKSTTLKTDGTVLYQTSLPVKNTGYRTVRVFLIPVLLLIGMTFVIVIAGRFQRKRGSFLILAAAIAVVAAAAIVIGGSELIQRCLADYRTVWIAGAPEYSYTEKVQLAGLSDAENIEQPLPETQYGQLRCEAAGLECPLYYGDNDEIFELGAGTYTGGYLPGEQGTILLGGHDTSYFSSLAEMSVGDEIEIDTIYGNYRYEVTGTKIAKAADKSAYGIEEGTEQLILYTCYPFGKTEELRNERFFVYASRVDKPESGE